MASYTISASALIPAPAQRVYDIIADYRNGHPHILPKPPFVSLAVEQGGVGTGTKIYVEMKTMGRVSSFRADVTEPKPGHTLVETNDNGYVTSFIVEPRENGQQSYVTISTLASGRSGLLGALEGWFVTRLLKPTYVKELGQLAAVAARG